MATITFLPAGVTGEVRHDESIFDVGKRLGVGIETSCVGKGTCGLCRVRIVAGEEHLSPYSDVEDKHLGNLYHLTKVRLSCQSKVSGDVTVELVDRRRRRKNRDR